jgi:imidazolonepropionase
MNHIKTEADLVIANANQLIQCKDDSPFENGVLENGWLAIKDKNIVAIGSKYEVEAAINMEQAIYIQAKDKVVVPGFVDSHTHLIFGGSRVDEYCASLTAQGAREIEEKNIKTGIMATVDATRSESITSLFNSGMARLEGMLRHGTTTVESKSGYGLSLEAEKKILETSFMLQNKAPVDIIPTFLGAHGWPEDISKAKYIELLTKEMLPWVADRGLAKYCDIWCDEGKYTALESEIILQAARDYGLEIKIHTDAYSYIGGSDLAAKMNMVSADHLNYTPHAVMGQLAEAGTVGVLMPALDFAVQHPKPFDYLAMKEAGMTLALATNLCPGCWTESMQFVMTLACRLYKFTPQEALLAATINGAKALNLDYDRGSLEEGKIADIQIWDVPSYEHAIYRYGSNVVEKVIKKGQIVYDKKDNNINNYNH